MVPVGTGVGKRVMRPVSRRDLLTGFGVALALARAGLASTLPQDGRGEGATLMVRITLSASTPLLADSHGSRERRSWCRR